MNELIRRHNPARPTELVGEVSVSTPAEVTAAVDRAAAAFPQWAATPFDDRAAAVLRAADRVEARIDELAPLLCAELGKVLPDCRGEIGFAAVYLRDAVETTRKILARDDVIDDDSGRMQIRRTPYGVVAAVTPWNAPIILSMLKIAPAVTTGNTVVVKPSPLAPLAVTGVIEEIAKELPDGVLTVVHGGPEAGRALTGHPCVAKIAFTGGLATGQAIMRHASERVVPMVLELGGNDAAILLDDADLSDAAVERLVHATFITSGQVCMAAKRVYVHRSRYDELVERYIAIAADALVVGDPMDPSTTVGPLVSEEARDRVAALVDGARDGGARVIELGTIADQAVFDAGWFLRPTLVLDAKDTDRIVADEQFGPTVPIMAFDDVDEVVARANDSDVGLGASVWSAHEERAFDVAARLETGFAFVNTHNRSGMALRAPFGGRKLSGFGREYGEAGILEYLAIQTINAPAAFRPGADGGAGAGYPT